MRKWFHSDKCASHYRSKPFSGQLHQITAYFFAALHQPFCCIFFIGTNTIGNNKRCKFTGNNLLAFCKISNRQSSAEGDCFIKLIFKQRRNKHCHYITPAGRKAGNSNIIGITTEFINIFLNPLQCIRLVNKSIVAAVIKRITVCQRRQIIKAKQS